MRSPAQAIARVLVVDDEAALVTALCETLADQHYETRGFTSALEALAALRESPFDVLLTDLSMPGTDGVALLKAALEVEPDLAGIIMTGQGTVQTAVEAMKIGACDYILKPFKLNALLPVIARAAQMRRLRSENIQLRSALSIYELSAAAAFTLNREQLLDYLTLSALRQSQHADTAILLASENARALRLTRVQGKSWNIPVGTVYPYDGRLAHWIAQCHEALADAVPEKMLALAVEHPYVHEFGGVALPMIVQARLIGVLILRRTDGRTLAAGEIKALEVLAGIGASALAAARLHEHVKDAEERYRAQFEGSPIPTWVVDVDTDRFLSVNEAAVRSYGWSHAEFLAMTTPDLCVPEDRERLRALFAAGRSQSGQAQPYRGQWRHRRKSGEVFDVVLEARRIQIDGRERRIATAVDISDRLAAEARLSALSRRVLEVQETERREVARELHDEIGQVLTAVKLSLEALVRAAGAHLDPDALTESIGLVDRALEQVRSLTLNLRPTVLDDLGLAPALRWLAARQQKLSGVRVEAAIDLPAARFDSAIETACFRIAQEALTNSVRHARPRRIVLASRIVDGALVLRVADDGAGFDLAEARAAAAQGRSAGLTGMEERVNLAGGALEVRSARGGGTEVRASFALASER